MRGQGRMFRRGRVYWISYYHRGREFRESSHSERETDARRLLWERLRDAGSQRFVGPAAERLTFDDLAEAYLTDYRVNGRRSQRRAERAVHWLRTVFGFSRALDITPDRINAYIETRLRDRATQATVNRELAALRRMLSLAVRAGKLPARPHIPALEEHNAREGFFEAPEFEVACIHLPPDVADAATFAYLTGWRRGEVRTLQWPQVHLDEEQGVIRLRAAFSKSKRGRVIVLRGELLDLIRRRHALRRLGCPFVFHRNGRPLGDFRIAWRRACAAAGVSGRVFHDLRKTGIRNMIRAGVPERVAMEISGHRTRSVFDRYNIVSEQDLADAAERTTDYVRRERSRMRRVVPLREVERGQKADI